jgi:hypothetical protein
VCACVRARVPTAPRVNLSVTRTRATRAMSSAKRGRREVRRARDDARRDARASARMRASERASARMRVGLHRIFTRAMPNARGASLANDATRRRGRRG